MVNPAMSEPYDLLEQNDRLWNLFTREEEHSHRKLDKYDRYIHSFSSYPDVLRPEVSEYLVENGLEAKYPENKPFAVCLTHDVDEIYPPLSHTLRSSIANIRKGRFGKFRDHLLWHVKGKEYSPYWNFQEIIDLEAKYEAQSSFYFLASKKDIDRFRYNIEDLEGRLGQIVDQGWEVGLHGGYYSYNDLNEIIREKERLEAVLGRTVTGCRNHYLRFKVPDTWRLLENAGFKYDTTLGYSDTVGFRNGMCHPFKPVDFTDGHKVLNIFEIPLVIMDGPLFFSTKDYDKALVLAKKLIDIVGANKGVITLNWHTQYFNCPFREHWQSAYEELLKYCFEKNAWLTSGEKIWKWFDN